MAVVNAAPYGSGILAKGPDAYARYAYQDAPAEIIERTRKLAAVCQEFDVPLIAAALQFSLRDPRHHHRGRHDAAGHVQQTLELAAVDIPDELWAQLDAVGYDEEDPEAHRFK
ncbi:MAG: hypothetical protein R2911_26925 [Caldilineaceae bacterium]